MLLMVGKPWAEAVRQTCLVDASGSRIAQVPNISNTQGKTSSGSYSSAAAWNSTGSFSQSSTEKVPFVFVLVLFLPFAAYAHETDPSLNSCQFRTHEALGSAM